jgi:hypothetical protein
MEKFIYKIEDGRTIVDCDGEIEEIAMAVGRLANAVYSAYLNTNPELAAYFRLLVTAQFAAEASPVWTPHVKGEGDIEIIENTYEEGTVS